MHLFQTKADPEQVECYSKIKQSATKLAWAATYVALSTIKLEKIQRASKERIISLKPLHQQNERKT